MFEIDNAQDHFVPRMYLKRFSLPDETDKVYVFDKQNPRAGVVKRSIRKVERSRDAYTIEADRFLKELEGTWNNILNFLEGKDVAVSAATPASAAQTKSRGSGLRGSRAPGRWCCCGPADAGPNLTPSWPDAASIVADGRSGGSRNRMGHGAVSWPGPAAVARRPFAAAPPRPRPLGLSSSTTMSPSAALSNTCWPPSSGTCRWGRRRAAASSAAAA